MYTLPSGEEAAKNAGSGHIGLRILAGVTTGGLAVLCAQPTDVVKVRMQAEKAGEPRRYTGSIMAYRTIGKTEGIKGLWKGRHLKVGII